LLTIYIFVACVASLGVRADIFLPHIWSNAIVLITLHPSGKMNGG